MSVLSRHHPGRSFLRAFLAQVPVSILLVAGTLLTLSAAGIVGELETQRRRSDFERRVEVRTDSLRRRLDAVLESVRAVGSLFDASDEVSREEFREFVRPRLATTRGVAEVRWVPARGDPFREWPAGAREAGAGSGNPRPTDGFGPDWLASLESRIPAADLGCVGPVHLPDSGDSGYAIVLPVYRREGERTYSLVGEPHERAGHVSALVRVRDLVESAPGEPGEAVGDLRLLDLTGPTGPVLVHADAPPAGREDSAFRILRFADRTWRAEFRPDPVSARSGTSSEEGLVLAGGLLLTGLASFLLLILGRSRRQARALERANRDLAREVSVRQAAERKYRSLVEQAIFGIFRSSPDGRILDVNPAFVRMLGYDSAEDVLSLDLARDVYADPTDRARIVDDFRSGETDRSVDLRWRRRGGESFWVRLTGRAVRDAKGRVRCFETFTEDVTEKIRYEEQVSRARRVEAIGRLAGGIAHDFNNLLTVILGHSRELAEHEEVPEDLKRRCGEVAKSGERAAELTRQLLAFARQQVLNPRAIDLNRVVEESVALLARLIREDITVETDLAPDLGTVRVDRAQMSQVVMNLALNARDAMHHGGLLSLSTRNVEIRKGESVGEMGEPGRFVLLSVRDSGEGMDRETRAHIFDPFFTTKEDHGGTGLGLATVYGIVKQSGGWIRVTSQIGGGSTFDVFLPRSEEAPVEDEDRADGTGSAPAASGTLLVAEDEDAVRELACEALRSRGWTVLEAGDGREAWRIFTERESEIDGLVTDMVMPRMGGGELARRVRERRADVGILCMSGYSARAVECHGAPSDGTGFLEKPFDLDDLADRVRASIEAVRNGASPRHV